jgi:Uma2 family endonuclease
MSTAVEVRYTPEQYLALERKAEFRSEYIDGGIYPMSGARSPHIDIVVALARIISTWLIDRPGHVYTNDMRVYAASARLFTYPDVVVVEGEPQLLDDEFDTLLNPAVIIEVLSPSTEDYDRGDKFARYRRLDTLREYILVAQDQVRVERYTRQGEEWPLTAFTGLDDVLRLESIGCDVPLRQVYAKTPLAGQG